MLVSFTQLSAQCTDGEVLVTVEILTDNYPAETSFTLIDENGNILLEGAGYQNANTLYTDAVCVSPEVAGCVHFTLNDSYGDGICCGYGEGYANLYYDGELIATGGDFNYSTSYYFNCDPGQVCEEAFPLTSMGDYNTIFNETWYVLTPDTTGVYQVNTCFPETTCNTTIWIYDNCGSLIDETVQGTFAFNDDPDDEECGDLAMLTVYLTAGDTYYIRLGSSTQDCNNTTFPWSIEFSGEIEGCTDPTACNYNPIATISSGDCIYPGDPECPDGPDLLVREDVFINSMYIEQIDNTDGCYVQEGCLSGYGARELLRFTTRIDNIGQYDYYIGSPPDDVNAENEQWEFDACHNHWHYEGYAEYRIYNDEGFALPNGYKNGFCVIDLVCDTGTPKYSCGNQGITAGCGDIYGANLACQWYDITDLPAGTYTFAIAVNWDQSPDALGFIETDYSNNWAQACLEITRDPATGEASFTVLEDCETYVDCEGTPYGDASEDCAGNCNGTRIAGDIDIDNTRGTDDITIYINESLQDTITTTPCLDLNDDGDISVTDLTLLLHCTLHEGQGTQPGHNHFPCDFPFSITNPQHFVTLGVGEYSVEEKWFEIGMLNPLNPVSAFEFEISGAEIENVELLLGNSSFNIFHDDTEILGFSYQEETIEKHNTYYPFVRVHVSEWLDTEVCIAEITAIVNDALEETETAAWICAEIPLTSVNEPTFKEIKSQVIPNPTQTTATIYFDNADKEKCQINVLDAQGRLLQQFNNIKENNLQIDLSEFSNGVYFYKIVGQQKTGFGKFIKG